MAGIKKHFRTQQIKKQAYSIAVAKGERIAGGGWKYDDSKLSIVVERYETTVYYANKKGKKDKVFFYCSAPKSEYYHEGEWEQYFDNCYKTTKTRPK